MFSVDDKLSVANDPNTPGQVSLLVDDVRFALVAANGHLGLPVVGPGGGTFHGLQLDAAGRVAVDLL